MTSSLVGSEMCIRDSMSRTPSARQRPRHQIPIKRGVGNGRYGSDRTCLLYTSDAATICSV
eukprot:3265310-Prorocentrum_lima.AAC.1